MGLLGREGQGLLGRDNVGEMLGLPGRDGKTDGVDITPILDTSPSFVCIGI